MDVLICSSTNWRAASFSSLARHLAPPATTMGSKNVTPMRLVSFLSTMSKRWSQHQNGSCCSYTLDFRRNHDPCPTLDQAFACRFHSQPCRFVPGCRLQHYL